MSMSFDVVTAPIVLLAMFDWRLAPAVSSARTVLILLPVMLGP